MRLGTSRTFGVHSQYVLNLRLADRHQLQADVTPINSVLFLFVSIVRWDGILVSVPTYRQIYMVQVPTGVFTCELLECEHLPHFLDSVEKK